MDVLSTDISRFCFIDSETRRAADATIEDVTKVGAYRYAQQAAPNIWAFGIGEQDTGVYEQGGRHLKWADMPPELHEFYELVVSGDAWFVAWNAAFDRLVWNSPLTDFPPTRPEHWLDAMAQATASGLPGKLMHASKWVGGSRKLEQGSTLMKLFEPPDAGDEENFPKQWDEYCDYAAGDIDAMRDIWKSTRPLTVAEWETYWASERINDRGMLIDREFAARAFILNETAKKIASERIDVVTDGAVTAVSQAKALLWWCVERAKDPELLKMLTNKKQVLHEDGSVKREASYTIARDRIELMLAYLDSYDDLTPDETAMKDALTLRLWGGSTTPSKFKTALSVAQGGAMRGQYVFNGAAQTGRFSSRGVQTHNLTRSHLGDQEDAAIEYINALEDPRVERLLEETS